MNQDKNKLLDEYIKVLNQIMYGLEKLDHSKKVYEELNKNGAKK